MVSLGGAGTAEAAEWSMDPSLSVKAEYNSNLLLFDGDNEVWGHWLSPGVMFKGATESLDVDGSVKGDFVRYYGEQDRELTNLYFPLRTSYRRDRYTFGFEGGFTRDNTLMGELQQTGFVLSFTQRNLWTAMPSVTVGLTERLSWQVGYQFMDASYENGLRLGLVDYHVHGGTSAVSYRLTERDRMHVKGDYINFQTPVIDQEWNYYGAGLGFSHDFSESLTVALSGGARLVETVQNFPGGSLSDKSVVWVYSGNLRKEFEQGALSLEASREVNPSGFGFLLQTDRFGGALAYRATDTVTFSVNGAVYLVSFATNPLLGAAPPEARFASVSPKVAWKLSQWWTLEAGYSYAERGVGALSQWNFANSTFVILTYQGPKWSVSR